MRASMLRAFLLLVVGLGATGRLANAAAGTSQADALKLNVLFIAVDDLRCEMGCWGNDYGQVTATAGPIAPNRSTIRSPGPIRCSGRRPGSNIAADPENEALVRRLEAELQAGWKAAAGPQ